MAEILGVRERVRVSSAAHHKRLICEADSLWPAKVS